MQLFSIFMAAAACQFFIFSIFLLTLKKGNRLANALFAAFLLSKMMCFISHFYPMIGEQIFRSIPHLFFVYLPFDLSFAPLLYLYTKSMTNKNYRPGKTELLHFLPFLIALIYFSIIIYTKSTGTLQKLIQQENIMPIQYWFYFWLAVHIQIFIYLLLSFKRMMTYQAQIKNVYSSLEKINLVWLKSVLGAFLFVWLVIVSDFILYWIFDKEVRFLLYFIEASFFIFGNIILFKGLHQPVLFAGIETMPTIAKNSMKPIVSQRYAEKLTIFMQQEKPYLVPSLTVFDLSQKAAIPHRNLSHVLNQIFKQNFFDFINSYRIEEAKKIMSVSSLVDRTILEVLYEVGFNSKSVFNEAFKKHAGMTPTQFRQVYLYNASRFKAA